MDNGIPPEIKRLHVEKVLKQEFECTVSDRARRYLEIPRHPITAAQHFSGASAECMKLYRDGHFYGCISLVQAVAEALVRFMCERNSCKPAGEYEENVDKLETRKFITAELKEWLVQIWNRRNDYHHLNSCVETDYNALEKLAKEKVTLLNEVEAVVFKCDFAEGKIVPAQPKYWDIEDGTMPVYLRCE